MLAISGKTSNAVDFLKKLKKTWQPGRARPRPGPNPPPAAPSGATRSPEPVRRRKRGGCAAPPPLLPVRSGRCGEGEEGALRCHSSLWLDLAAATRERKVRHAAAPPPGQFGCGDEGAPRRHLFSRPDSAVETREQGAPRRNPSSRP